MDNQIEQKIERAYDTIENRDISMYNKRPKNI
jgi:hypothetical protein